ncbi:MAG TPA: hypothetical protein VKF39_05865 [Nitrososphaerales archaeon]|nr:hypothetical protein [Nitrososphaerales archaeon]
MPDSDLEDLNRRVSVSQAMLDRVIHTTDNLDEKVGRIFTSMSFLTVGATILFTSFLTNKLLLFDVGGVSVVSIAFLGFIISVAVATGYMLLAMGPRFRINPWERKSAGGQPLGPSPTGYADKISAMKEEAWTEYFRGIQLSDLYEKWFAETMDEVYELSKKVNRKVREMRRAQEAFLLAIFFLIVMILLAVYQLI